MSLYDFLAETSVENIMEEISVSSRIPEKFKIKPISNKDFNLLQNQCKKMDFKSKEMKFDSGKFNEQLVINCCIYPDFRNSDFITRVGVNSPEQLINKVLLCGEISEISEKIQALSGFGDNDEAKEEVKNF
jgi:hypothetical protein